MHSTTKPSPLHMYQYHIVIAPPHTIDSDSSTPLERMTFFSVHFSTKIILKFQFFLKTFSLQFFRPLSNQNVFVIQINSMLHPPAAIYLFYSFHLLTKTLPTTLQALHNTIHTLFTLKFTKFQHNLFYL